MKKSTLIIICVIGLAGLVIAYFVFNSKSGRRFQWYESYDANSDQPYGTLFMRKLLESYVPEGSFYYNTKKPVYEILDSSKFLTGVDYVFIGPSDNLDSRDQEALIEFMRRGNNVFIASLDIPNDIVSAIYKNEVCESSIYYRGEYTDSAIFNFYHDSLRRESGYVYDYSFAGIKRQYYWNYLDQSTFCDSTMNKLVPLGYQAGDVVNFFKIPFDKGNLYIHTNPLVFTNYYLIHADKMEYTAGVFSHLDGDKIIWDEYSKIPFSENHNSYNSPLYFIMQQPSLKYAWWMMLATVGLFVLFAAKRKQRVIPVFEPKTNTSLEFVNMISSLHFQNGDHLDMARKKMKYFLYFIRAKYGIHTSTFTKDHVSILAEKSRVKEAEVQYIYDRWNVIEIFGGSGIEYFRLSDLYFAIERFYKLCR